MKYLKSFLVFLAAVSLGFWLYLAITAFSITHTVGNPAYIKALLVKSNVYENFVDDVLKLASAQNGSDGGNNKAQIEQLTPVVKQAITPAVLQSTVEEFINGTAHWLTGKSAEPDFVIQLAPIKAQLITAATDSAYSRVVSLPVCPRGVIPVSDPFTATCKPGGQINKSDFQPGSEQFVGQLPFFDKDTLTYQTITASKNNQTPAKPLPKQIPIVYQWSKISPFVIGFLAFLSVLIIVLLKRDHMRAWKTVGHTFLVVGIILVITSVAGKVFLNHPITIVKSTNASQQLFAVDIIQPIIKNFSLDVSNYTLYFGAFYLLIAAICYVVGLQIKRRNHIEQLADAASSADTPAEIPTKSVLNDAEDKGKESSPTQTDSIPKDAESKLTP